MARGGISQHAETVLLAPVAVKARAGIDSAETMDKRLGLTGLVVGQTSPGEPSHLPQKMSRGLVDVLVMMIPRRKFLKLLENEPRIAIAVMSTLSRRVRALQAAASV
jgi:hypothetical protein